VQSALRRAELVGRGRFVGGGAYCEAFIEQLAVLHIVNVLFVSKMQFDWVKLFVITHRGAGRHYEARIRRAIGNGLPFIVQRCGRFGCIVPAPPEDAARAPAPTSHALAEHRLGIPPHLTLATDAAAVMYDGADVFDALTVWARFMLDYWDGRIVHVNKRAAPLLRAMLGGAGNDAADASEAAPAAADAAAAAVRIIRVPA